MDELDKDKKYLYLNEIDNAINSLNVAKNFIEKDEIFKWKWVTIALHHSLYSFCISALVNGNYDNVLAYSKKEDTDQWVTRDNVTWKRLYKQKRDDRPYYKIVWQSTNEYPMNSDEDNHPKEPKENNKNEKLIGFWTALARVMDGEWWMGRLVCTQPLQLTDDDLEKIYWATEFVRNDLIHFIPKIKILDVIYLKKCLTVMVHAIEFIALESKSISEVTMNSHPSINEAILTIKKELSH